MGKDFTIHAKIDGVVKFKKNKTVHKVSDFVAWIADCENICLQPSVSRSCSVFMKMVNYNIYFDMDASQQCFCKCLAAPP